MSEQVLDREGIARALSRIARQILERNQGASGIAIVGIQRRGDWLARRLAEAIREAEDTAVPVGVLDINLYRDDLQVRADYPVVRTTDIPFDIEGRTVILVDDVLYTGRTIRAALDELKDFGRARRIELAVLIDREGRELPIQADYIGETIEVGPGRTVVVRVHELDRDDNVAVEEMA
ncbi:MAG: bifunctional pyr operon transcriptional regulator/uracil phosphoribosyltransferase PyrR [candidate division Zixibacteria bacterium]|nr:bifunctional pyr operon transcriptional regulator/uracil phosphoribosyltransferase PyrR [candidate division Zixibacteria bacterium]